MVTPEEIRIIMEKMTTLDLETVRLTVFNENRDWWVDRTNNAVDGYRKFLVESFIQRKNGGARSSPTDDVDKVWHAHILDTEKYHRDCEAIFGEYIHHTPRSYKIGDRCTTGACM